MRITHFIIALIIVGVFASSITLFMSNLATEYSGTYDESTLSSYDELEELNNLTVQLDDTTNQQNTESGLFDVVGNYISRAINSLKVAKQSAVVFNSMSESAMDDLHLPAYFKTAVWSIIVVLIIGLIIYAMIKVPV